MRLNRLNRGLLLKQSKRKPKPKIDLDSMSKDEIEALVLKKTGVNIDKRRSKSFLVEQAKKLLGL